MPVLDKQAVKAAALLPPRQKPVVTLAVKLALKSTMLVCAKWQ
jgi:hypothetical protein